MNCIPVLSSKSWQTLAHIALVSQYEKSLANSILTKQEMNFDGSAWDRVQGLASPAESTDQIGKNIDQEDINYVGGGTIQSTHNGLFRHDHPIPINAKSVGRRRRNSSKGKWKVLSGQQKKWTFISL